MEYTYQIGGKTYIQRPLVLAQIRQLLELLQGVVISGDIGTIGMVRTLGSKLPEALAVVLTEPGQSLKDKNIADQAAEIDFAIPPEQAIQVVEDFFICNPAASLLERLAGMTERIGTAMTGLKGSASSSAGETSPGATSSSGDTP